LTDLLMLPARKRMADQAFVAVQQEVASEVLEELLAVELAWFEAVGAQHVATMRGLVAKAARQSAELAKRFHAAGNIEPLQLAQERANAASTEIEAVTARAEALKARTVLAILLGIDSAGSWQLEESLAAPLTTQASESRYRLDVLVQQALARRLDLAAKQQALALKQQSLALVRRWRLLGHVEIGGERESEAEGSLRGPSIELALPLFNQGQGALARAEAETKIAEIELAAQIHVVKQDVHQHLEWMQAAAKIADAYRESLVPASQEIVQQSQAKVNFMLMGVFELLAAKREEYDAYEAYLSAVRDYWTARALASCSRWQLAG
jgi:cobalt-zinc-cadmium efflux system outer membrane protein